MDVPGATGMRSQGVDLQSACGPDGEERSDFLGRRSRDPA